MGLALTKNQGAHCGSGSGTSDCQQEKAGTRNGKEATYVFLFIATVLAALLAWDRNFMKLTNPLFRLGV